MPTAQSNTKKAAIQTSAESQTERGAVSKTSSSSMSVASSSSTSPPTVGPLMADGAPRAVALRSRTSFSTRIAITNDEMIVGKSDVRKGHALAWTRAATNKARKPTVIARSAGCQRLAGMRCPNRRRTRTVGPRARPQPTTEWRAEDAEQRDRCEREDDRPPEPGPAVQRVGKEEVALGRVSQDERQQEGRAWPVPADRRHADGAGQEHDDDVGEAVVGRVGPEREQHQQERDEQRPLDVGQARELLEEQERYPDG